jgi:ABC-type nickel/cobalt efflux system permease component RcnA
MTKKLKRWTFLDSLNAILFIVVVLFFLDFDNNNLMSWILLAVFAFWLVTVILRNVMISKIEKDPQHPLHNLQTGKDTGNNVKK